MALGGGTWMFQNKKLPGTYINFVSKVRAASSIAGRGYGTMPLQLSWGPVGSVFAVTAEEFQENSLKYFGYDYTADELKGLRDLFLNLKVGYFYRLDNESLKAAGTIARAKYTGVRGNDITVVVATNVDHEGAYDVKTYMTLSGVRTLVDEQKNCATWDDVKDNDFVTFIRTAELAANAGDTLTGGSDGSAITGLQYQDYLDAIQPYYFNTMGYAGTDATIQQLLIQACKRMRDNEGAKYQLVLYNAENVDYEGVISIRNAVTDTGSSPASLVYWTVGAEASCEINASCTNKTYAGEFTVNTKYTQTELEKAITDGMLMFHNVTDPVNGDVMGDVKVLDDINTYTSFTKSKNEDFSLNQVIRVLDQIAIDTANLFNKTYLEKEQNDDEGRVALWGDIVQLGKDYQKVRAIQNWVPDEIPIPQQGQSKTSVVEEYEVQPTCCMEKLYMKVVVA
jgi:hypothetical protein